MAYGIKTGGRATGTPNKATQLIIDKLDALGCDPINGMAQIALDKCNAPELRARMFAELAQYIAPKRKAVEIDTGDAHHVVFNIGIPQRISLESTAEIALLK